MLTDHVFRANLKMSAKQKIRSWKTAAKELHHHITHSNSPKSEEHLLDL